jgi:hypothetical protein
MAGSIAVLGGRDKQGAGVRCLGDIMSGSGSLLCTACEMALWVFGASETD